MAQFAAKRSALPAPDFLNGKESPSSTVVMGYDVHSTSPKLSEEARVGLQPCLGIHPLPFLRHSQSLIL